MKNTNFGASIFLLPLILFALWQNGSCHSDPTMKHAPQNRVAAGEWGGQNVRMTVTGNGAQLEFSCSRGTIDEAIVVNDNGDFSAKGTFIAERPGPTREDNPPARQPATYSGSVKDQDMTLTVTINKTKEQAGSFTLSLGKPGRIRRCH